MRPSNPGTSLRFISHRGSRGKFHVREDLDPAEVERELDRLCPRDEGVRVLKEDRKASVYAGLSIGGFPACVKIYRQTRRGRRGFENLLALWRQPVSVPEPFFLWERTRADGGGAAVGMEDLSPRPELDRWISELMERAGLPPSRDFLRREVWPVASALGETLRDFHGRGIYLDDMKTCNIFLHAGDEPRFYFIDLDGVKIGSTVSSRLRAKSLAQLNRSTPLLAGLGSRKAFWDAYRPGLPRASARRIRKKVTELSAIRPILYVTGRGVREEAWPPTGWDWPR